MELNLSRPILKAINDLNYLRPTPVQAQAIPVALEGADICANAATGSGKTAAFVLPALERLLYRDKRLRVTRVLILLPTRELAVQCHSNLVKLAKYTDITATLVVGGLSSKLQEIDLRKFPDVVVATPGRMIDHVRNSPGITLEDIEILILDEADRLLDMGFTEEVHELVKQCPKGRQSMLFSATMTMEVSQLAQMSLNNPARVSVNKNLSLASGITQEFIRVRKQREGNREAMLLALCTKTYKTRALIFFRTKRAAHRVKILFTLAGLNARELHGNLSQNQRLEALESFRDRECNYLLCTDLAARGLDIIGIKTIINYDLPKMIEQYIHRAGRTARWGNVGVSVSFVAERDRKVLKKIMKAKGPHEVMKSRKIPFEEIVAWQKRIDKMEKNTTKIIEQEAAEREMRVAQMEMNRMKNGLEFAAEIKSRPAKTWFQTKEQKLLTKQLTAKALYGYDSDDEEGTKKPKQADEEEEEDEEETTRKMKKKLLKKKLGKYSGMNRQKRRRIIFSETVAKERKEGGEMPIEMYSEKALIRSAKSVKSKIKARKSRQTASLIGGTKRKRSGDGSAFDVDLKRPRLLQKRYSQGKDEKRVREYKPRQIMGRGNVTQRGKHKGKAAFKSKKRFKRR
eukprot:TRINITY_DN1766_c0_g1_i1.p1 TRINITY_DN1766_c0_g1~~TRINITY_DN1766_c0_g1_i1.p1  ORF type:complete len:628 (-),score=139.98 TRINITY_DN1766_c0_g1_i1:51-1934(-)